MLAEQLPPKGIVQSSVWDLNMEIQSIGIVDVAKSVNSLCLFGTADLDKHVADGISVMSQDLLSSSARQTYN